MMKFLGNSVLAFALAASFQVSAGQKLKIVQIDLARQMETPSFISNYIERVSSLGFNTLQFYVEGRIGTRTFSLPEGECYPAATMRALVDYASSKGMVSVPVVSVLGHAELFFRYPGNEDISETREGNPRLGKGNDTFCISTPRGKEFLRRYLSDIAEIFPGKYFNVGLDEAWNAGICPLCAPKEKRDELFSETFLFAHEVLTSLGKQMWMWDDFFEFHPKAFARLPKDVTLCHWNYNKHISQYGSRGHFAGMLRDDLLAQYAEKGYKVIPAIWFRSGNLEALYGYARRHPMQGFMLTQWEEMRKWFPAGSLPRLAAASLLFKDPDRYLLEDPYPEAVGMVLPSLNPRERLAVATILHSDLPGLRASVGANLAGRPSIFALTALETAVSVLKASSLRPGTGEISSDPLSERAILDDIVLRGESALVGEKIARIVPAFSDPRRTASEVRSAKAALARLKLPLGAIARRRDAQQRAWRAGCTPMLASSMAEKSLKFIDSLAKTPESPAPADEKRLEITLSLVDYYGMPKWKVSGRFAGKWRELGKGIWKPGPGDWASFSKFITFRSATMPEEVRLDYCGYGNAFVNFVAMDDRSGRIKPTGIVAVSGDVKDAANMLVDDLTWAEFGRPGFLEPFYDQAKADAISSVTLAFPAAE